MELRRVTIALSFAGLASLATAAEGPDNKVPADPTKVTFRGAFTAVKYDLSPPLRSMTPVTIDIPQGDRPDDRLTGFEGPLGPQDVDMSVQTKLGSGEIPSPNLSFDAFSNMCGCHPPDSDGDVGPNHYVVMVNLHFAIYDKAGGLWFGPVANNTLWSGFGGPCQTENAGDPIVIHDQMANRWILTQFTDPGAPFFNCLAVSQTADPLGSYHRYQLPTPGFPDYPKWGVWPDAYYVSTREVGIGRIGAYAIDRAAVLAGNPAAQILSFSVTLGGTPYLGGDGLLPTDMDGSTLPAAGSPNYFVGTMDQGGPYGAPQDAITFWKFHADFVTPANSTFALTNTLPVDVFDSMLGTATCTTNRMCIPQPGTAARVDHLGYRQRPTWRLAYRNFGTHESLVTNQSVEAPAGMAGIRWYEIRNPNTATPIIFQQGTYSPGATDGIFRWMGSIAQDRAGNMALGYSASSDGIPPNPSVFPSVRYTGRLVTDPLGQMPQGEASIHEGGAAQTASVRWGDYTSMNVDPVDDCSFWYVNQYSPSGSWRIRVGHFRFPAPQCIPVPVALQGFSIE